MLDRHRDPRRDELQELHVGRRESRAAERSDVQYPENTLTDDEGHTGKRTDAFLAQDRIQHVGVRDIVEHDGPSVRRDAAGEPASHRNTHTTLDLLLDA